MGKKESPGRSFSEMGPGSGSGSPVSGLDGGSSSHDVTSVTCPLARHRVGFTTSGGGLGACGRRLWPRSPAFCYGGYTRYSENSHCPFLYYRTEQDTASQRIWRFTVQNRFYIQLSMNKLVQVTTNLTGTSLDWCSDGFGSPKTIGSCVPLRNSLFAGLLGLPLRYWWVIGDEDAPLRTGHTSVRAANIQAGSEPDLGNSVFFSPAP